jgi:hypothetical protein
MGCGRFPYYIYHVRNVRAAFDFPKEFPIGKGQHKLCQLCRSRRNVNRIAPLQSVVNFATRSEKRAENKFQGEPLRQSRNSAQWSTSLLKLLLAWMLQCKTTAPTSFANRRSGRRKRRQIEMRSKASLVEEQGIGNWKSPWRLLTRCAAPGQRQRQGQEPFCLAGSPIATKPARTPGL